MGFIIKVIVILLIVVICIVILAIVARNALYYSNINNAISPIVFTPATDSASASLGPTIGNSRIGSEERNSLSLPMAISINPSGLA